MIAGMVAGTPGHGGASWAVLQWVLSAEALGHDVTLIEEARGPVTERQRAHLERCRREVGLSSQVVIFSADSPDEPALEVARQACGRADVVVNLAGTLRDPRVLDAARRRVYVDLDPGFTQWWHADGASVGLDGHTHHVTVGAGIGSTAVHVPTHDRNWLPTLPPVALDRWPSTQCTSAPRLTTVANWRSYGPVERGGVRYGQKAHTFRELLALPHRAGIEVDVALGIDDGDVEDRRRLQRNGWRIVDPHVVATTGGYRDWIVGSWAEIGVAKHGYIVARTGWFSDRSACYLAAGRPVITSDTGCAFVDPDGEGIRSFRTVDEAADCVSEVRGHYAQHARAARAFAERHLDGRKVVHRLLEHVVG